MAREPTYEEWQDYHQMVEESKGLLVKDAEGVYTVLSVKAAQSGMANALEWLEALRR